MDKFNQRRASHNQSIFHIEAFQFIYGVIYYFGRQNKVSWKAI